MDERKLKNEREVLYINSGNEDAVRATQKFLNENGYTDGYGRVLDEDGEYGKNTFNAVIKYQLDNGLEADGKVGDVTWNSMWDTKDGREAEKYATDNESEHNYYAETELNVGGMKFPQNKTEQRKYVDFADWFNDYMTYVGAKNDYYGKGIDYNNQAYSPDGYVEKVESENALQSREEPVTGINEPYDMASYAQNYSDVIEQLYRKNRLSK